MPSRYDPAYIARRIVDRVAAGDVKTPGAWAEVVYQIGRLPPRLQEWTFQQLERVLTRDAYLYLRSWSSQQGVIAIAHQ